MERKDGTSALLQSSNGSLSRERYVVLNKAIVRAA
jgi:hypothetical protein